MATATHPESTRRRLLETAERLFAEGGLAATSLRRITTGAGVNLAAVSYHFGSKQGLIVAVFAERLGPLNAERLRRLDAAEAAAGGEPPGLENVLRAFVEPTLRLGEKPQGRQFLRLMGRLFTEAGDVAGEIFESQLQLVATRFLEALRRALPHLGHDDVCWRAHWVVAAMAHTIACPQKVELLSNGRCAFDDPDEVLQRLVPFLAAGLRAPAADVQETPRP